MSEKTDSTLVQSYIDTMMVSSSGPELNEKIEEPVKGSETLLKLEEVVEDFVYHCVVESEPRVNKSVFQAYTPIQVPHLCDFELLDVPTTENIQPAKLPLLHKETEKVVFAPVSDQLQLKAQPKQIDAASGPIDRNKPRVLTDISQLLTFNIDQTIYATDLSKIKEVVHFKDLTDMPLLPHLLMGYISLRNQVLPIIDLRFCLKSEKTLVTKWTCILVVQTSNRKKVITFGVACDRVLNIIDIDKPLECRPSNKISFPEGSLVDGLYHANSQMLVVLNFTKLFDSTNPANIGYEG